MLTQVRNTLTPMVLLAAVVVGCGAADEEPAFGFSEKDMQDVVIGDWKGTMNLTGRAPTTYTLSVTQAFPGTSPACGSRTFNNGPLCVESSSMNLDATLTSADGLYNAVKLKGSFFVIGLEMNSGELSLGGPGVSLAAGIDVGKTEQQVTVSGDQTGEATLLR